MEFFLVKVRSIYNKYNYQKGFLRLWLIFATPIALVMSITGFQQSYDSYTLYNSIDYENYYVGNCTLLTPYIIRKSREYTTKCLEQKEEGESLDTFLRRTTNCNHTNLDFVKQEQPKIYDACFHEGKENLRMEYVSSLLLGLVVIAIYFLVFLVIYFFQILKKLTGSVVSITGRVLIKIGRWIFKGFNS